MIVLVGLAAGNLEDRKFLTALYILCPDSNKTLEEAPHPWMTNVKHMDDVRHPYGGKYHPCMNSGRMIFLF